LGLLHQVIQRLGLLGRTENVCVNRRLPLPPPDRRGATESAAAAAAAGPSNNGVALHPATVAGTAEIGSGSFLKPMPGWGFITQPQDAWPQQDQRLTALQQNYAAPASAPAVDALENPLFLCPITQEVMQHPVIAADGYTYDSEAIKV
jgi:hypothetical protein